MTVHQFVRKLVRSENGATAVEYGLIVALIVLAIIGSMSMVATKTNAMWTKVANEVNNR